MSQTIDSADERDPDDGWEREALEYQTMRSEARGGPAQGRPPIPQGQASQESAPIEKRPEKRASQKPARDPLSFPASISRSALFGVGRGSARSAGSMNQVPIKSQGGALAQTAGPRLDMSDKAVWEAVVGLVRENGADEGGHAPVSLRECAKLMGWSDRSGKALGWIRARIERLCEARFEIEGSGALPLLRSFRAEAGLISVSLAGTLTERASSHGAQIRSNPARRARLSSALAKWLHDFLSSHSDCRDLTLGYLRELSGFEGQARRFPALLSAALAELQALAPELLARVEIDRARRSGDLWTLTWKRGAEKANYSMPKTQARPAAHARKRGGVAL